MRAIEAVTAKGETSALCQSIGVSRASLYRRRRPTPPATPRRPRAPSPRALVPAERRAVRDTLHSARFVDQSPAEVYATLLEEQTYLCSPRTMYRVLAEADEVRERRDQVRHPAYVKPELVATAPNQGLVLGHHQAEGPVPYLYYSLYVILDLFSRYVVAGWWRSTRAPTWRALDRADLREAAHRAAAAHDSRRPRRAHAQQARRAVVLRPRHRGQHSRPRVSNDNPFSEAQFRTVKYRPEFPKLFGALEHARAICHDLLAWYNDAHHHSGLSYLTPADVHYGRAPAILDLRHRTRRVAYAAHPERFGQRTTTPRNLADRRMDQSAVRNDPPGCPRTDDRHPGRLPACGRCPAATAARSVVVAPRRWRGVATVNAEPGCLKDVDTARIMHPCDGDDVYRASRTPPRSSHGHRVPLWSGDYSSHGIRRCSRTEHPCGAPRRSCGNE